MEILKEIFWVAFYITGILAITSIAIAIILGVIETITNKIQKKKALKELDKSFDDFCKALHTEIEKEEAKETKKVSKAKKSK